MSMCARKTQSEFSCITSVFSRTDCESPASFWCSYPVANVSTVRNKKQVCSLITCLSFSNLSFCLTIKTSFQHFALQVMTFGQPYQISLLLEMPESEANQAQGMFMIRTAFYSQSGGQVATSTSAVN